MGTNIQRTTTTLTPKLRFPEFRNAPGWPRTKLDSVLTDRGLTSDCKSEVHSVSLTKGIVPQIEHMGRSFAASNTDHYSLVQPFDIVYTRSPLAIFKLGIVKQHKRPINAIVSPLYGVFTPKNRHLGLLLEAYFESPARSIRYLDPLAQKGAKNTIQLSNDRFLSGSLYLPQTEDEQRKIAVCLTSLDELLAAEERKLLALAAHKKGLIQLIFPRPGESRPRIRLPEFRNGPEWEELAVGSLITTIAPPKKIQTTSYAAEGAFPIVDQSRAQECGRTDDPTAVITPNRPVIVFGDHTCTLKLLRQPFAQGADGIKILDSGESVNAEFLFQALQVRPLESNEYKRHFTELKEKLVTLPREGHEEQRQIAAFLGSVDALIAAASKKLGALRAHKKGLMQQLFPSPEGE